jgi:hypothetical protein
MNTEHEKDYYRKVRGNRGARAIGVALHLRKGYPEMMPMSASSLDGRRSQ